MEPISPFLKAKTLKQETNNCQNIVNVAKANISDAKLKNLDEDKLEVSKAKESKKGKSKKSIIKKLVAAGALIGASCLAVYKVKEFNAKKTITALYDEIFNNMEKQNLGFDFNFEKPKLIFKKLKGEEGAYIFNRNEIQVDWRRLRTTCVRKDLTKVGIESIGSNIELQNGNCIGSLFQLLRKGRQNDYRLASKNEATAIMGAALFHELAHARQFQIFLSSENAKEKFISAIRNNMPNVSGKLEDLYPFVFSYQPKSILPADTKYSEILLNKLKIQYTAEDILNAFTKYTNSNKLEYYTNLTEISARNGERTYWDKLASGELKRPDGVSDEFVEYFRNISTYNAKILFDNVAVNKK